MTSKDLQTEEKIFIAASDEFEEKGMDGARMQDIADRAGINKALLHYYFRTKDKLFAAVFDRLAEKMFAKFAGIFETDLPINKKIETFLSEHISFLEKNPNLPLFLLREINRNPELMQRILSKVDFSRIKEGLDDTLSDNNIPEEQLAHLLVSVISLSVFPIVAKPIIEGFLIKQDINYKDFIQERKEYTPWFFMSAIQGMAANPYNPKSS